MLLIKIVINMGDLLGEQRGNARDLQNLPAISVPTLLRPPPPPPSRSPTRWDIVMTFFKYSSPPDTEDFDFIQQVFANPVL